MTNNDKLMLVASGFNNKLEHKEFVEVNGNRTIEILNFQMDFDTDDNGIINLNDIFKTKLDYVQRELNWYNSMNPQNGDIAPYAQIWSTASDKRGMTNSNYGYLIYSPQNGYQYDNVLKHLVNDKSSRKAVMYYTNPHMHYTGGNDHVCTLSVQYYIRNNELSCTVNMRSNDLVFGLIGADLSWQIHVLKDLHSELQAFYNNIKLGSVNWNATSLHIYERHFKQLKKLFK